MKNSTLRIIVLLVGLLFLNIEAAHAGLVHKLKIYIISEFGDTRFLYLLGLVLVAGLLCYVIFAPVLIGKERWDVFRYYTFDPTKNSYQRKRSMVRNIAATLNNKESVKSARH